MNIPLFKVGEVVGDELGTIGEITHVTPGIQFPYRILEEGGKSARYSDGEHLRLVTRPVREQWSFTGRESHWGYTFLVWTRDDGKRFARVVW